MSEPDACRSWAQIANSWRRWIILPSLLLMPIGVWADTDLGQQCWETNFVDTLSASVKLVTGTTNRYSLSEVVWRAQSLYQFVRVSAAALRHPADGTVQFAPLLVSNDSELFSGHHDCRIEINLLAATTSGTFTIVCTPDPLQAPADPFAVGGTLTFIGSCDLVAAPAQSLAKLQAGVRSAGEAPQ